jgi:hypothetical protein
MRYELKPLGVGGILDQAIQIFKDRLGLFLLITLILRIPATAVIQYLVLTNMSTFPMQPSDAQLNEFFTRLARLYLFVFAPAFLVDFLLVSPITDAALIHATARIYLGEKVGLWPALRMALRRYCPFVWTSLIFSVLLSVGLACCLLPGILVGLRFLLSPTITVLERQSGLAALSRSGDLMRSAGYENYLTAAGLFVGLFFIQGGIGAVSSFVPQIYLQVLANALFGSISFTFAIIVKVVFYYSCRCRNEGFDLLHLARLVAETPIDKPVLQAQG